LLKRHDTEEVFEEFGEGPAAMAEGELGLDVEFGHGLFAFGEIEEGVVAEAVCALGRGQDLAFDCASACAEDLAVAGGGEDTVIAGGTIFTEGGF
jgi:hypothetical protein